MEALKNIKAVIFDMDGTLIDTEKIYRLIWPITLKEMGLTMKEEHYMQMRSLGRPFAPIKMKEWYGQDFDYDGARARRKIKFENYIAEHGIQCKKGAIELLEFLHSRGIVTAIATATDMERAERYLEMTNLTGHFDKVISATMVKEGKPSPYVYEYACEQLGFKPDECLAVEDAPNGILSAYRAGCKVIMVPDQSQPDSETSARLTACVDSLDQIIYML